MRHCDQGGRYTACPEFLSLTPSITCLTEEIILANGKSVWLGLSLPSKHRRKAGDLPDVYLPVPVSVTNCGVVGSESFAFKVALREPVAPGLNVTVMEQEPLPWTVPLQLFVWLKSRAFKPLKAKLVMLIAVALAFVKVTALVAELLVLTLPKPTDPGDTVRAFSPVPASPTVCGLRGALSANVSPAVRLPVKVGSKVTVTVQSAPIASELPQLFV